MRAKGVLSLRCIVRLYGAPSTDVLEGKEMEEWGVFTNGFDESVHESEAMRDQGIGIDVILEVVALIDVVHQRLLYPLPLHKTQVDKQPVGL